MGAREATRAWAVRACSRLTGAATHGCNAWAKPETILGDVLAWGYPLGGALQWSRSRIDHGDR
jgi:hypothetical protein